MELNRNFLALKGEYLFTEVARRVSAFTKEHPERDVIKLSLGDVTRPLPPAVVEAMKRAVEDLSRAETFKGYAPAGGGYPALIEAVKGRYTRRNVTLESGEIFISDGAKADCGNLSELFSERCTALVPDPVYPVYRDSNLLAGRKILYLDGTEENGFLPLPEGQEADLIYLCSPNNPTGAVYDREGLRAWVDYANGRGAVILFDAAYEAYIADPKIPHSIFEIEGARECAIEICSLSKTAGFTGVRCGYTVVPHELKREGVSLNAMWARRQATKFNGASYISQMGAVAALSEEGERQIAENIRYYMRNATMISACLKALGIWHTGGIHSPYLWLKCLFGDSNTFFEALLNGANIVGTPGSGFGARGEGYLRLTAFAPFEETARACQRILEFLQ